MRGLLMIVVLSSTARADVPSPAEEACRRKQIGDDCGGGTCAMTTCSRTRPGPDHKPVTTTWDCVQCGAGLSGVDDDNPGPLRIAVGVGVAAAFVAGGVWFAYRKRRA